MVVTYGKVIHALYVLHTLARRLLLRAAVVRRNPSRLISDLYSAGLIWWWLSARRGKTEAAQAVTSPEIRHLTQLTADTSAWLAEDVNERDLDGFPRSIALIGASASGSFQNASDFRGALTSFAADEPSRIEAVVVQLGDSQVEHVFVRCVSPPAVDELLKRWNLEESKAAEVIDYRKLRTATLENVIHSMTALAFQPAERPLYPLFRSSQG